MKRILLVALAVTVALVVCAQSDEGEKPAPEAVKEAKTEVVKEEVKEPAKVDFEKPVVTLFAKRCAGCHGAEGGSAGLALVEKPVLSGALVVASSQMTDMHIVKPGHPAKSYLMLNGASSARLGDYLVELIDGELVVNELPPDGWKQLEMERLAAGETRGRAVIEPR